MTTDLPRPKSAKPLKPGIEETLIGRVLPQNLDAERNLLSCLLQDPSLINYAVPEVSESDFFRIEHRALFKALLGMHSDGKPITVVSLCAELEEAGLLDGIGGSPAISSLSDVEVPSKPTVVHYAKLVRKTSLRRAVITETSQACEAAYDGVGDPGDLLFGTVERLLNIGNGLRPGAVAGAETGVNEAMALFDMEGKEDTRRVWTYMPSLDNIVRGMLPGQLIIIGGRPGSGKSTAALNIMRYNAQRGVPSLLFSLEMMRGEIWHNIIMAEAQVTAKEIAKRTENAFSAITRAGGVVSNWPVFVDETGGATLQHISSVARRYVQERGVRFIVVDYLQLIPGTRGKEDTREQEVASVSRTLKSLAKNLGVPVIALVQLNRETERRSDDHRPRISDLRETGQMEMDADVVMLLWRPESYGINDIKGLDVRGKVEVVIAKQRNGGTGGAMLNFYGPMFQVYDTIDAGRPPSPGGEEREPLPYEKHLVAKTKVDPIPEEPPEPVESNPAAEPVGEEAPPVATDAAPGSMNCGTLPF